MQVHAKGITITDAAPTPHATLKAAAAVAEPQNANDHDHQLESDSDEGEELAHPVEVALPQPPGMGTSKASTLSPLSQEKYMWLNIFDQQMIIM